MTTPTRWLIGVLVFAALLLSGPLLMLASDEIRLGTSWRDADRSPGRALWIAS